MSAHHANLVLCWQTFISPTLITALNHKKILQRYHVQQYKFLRQFHNSIHENKLNFTTCYIIHTRAFHSERSFTAPQSHNDNDTESNIERETNVDDGIGWYYDTSTCSNSKHTHLKCLELWKPIYPEQMFAHHANLVLWWQAFISPTLITSLNHQKIPQRCQV
jgi:hypothetical protein